ncbi:MAG: hypothetical protein ACRDLB_06495 [Actinomycetota bacterium]
MTWWRQMSDVWWEGPLPVEVTLDELMPELDDGWAESMATLAREGTS